MTVKVVNVGVVRLAKLLLSYWDSHHCHVRGQRSDGTDRCLETINHRSQPKMLQNSISESIRP